MKLLRRISILFTLTFNILAVATLLLADLGQFINPSVLAFPSLIGLGFEWIVIVNIFFSIAWLFTSRKKLSLVSGIALLFSITPIRHTFALPFGYTPSKTNTQKISILSYNTRRLDMAAKTERNRILQYIREQKADIVCMQEFETYKNNKHLTLTEVKQYLSSYPYSYIDFKIYKGQRQYGLAVFSKYPLLHKRTLHYDSNTNISNCCDIVIGTDTLRLFNNHLESNRLTEHDLSLLTNIQDMSSDDMRSSAGSIAHKLRHAYQFRSQQADYICREIQASPYPVIVCGDFNDVPVSYLYKHISKNLRDAFLESNRWGTGHTFNGKGLGWRIDYILYSNKCRAYDFRIDKLPYSDHYPIQCKISW